MDDKQKNGKANHSSQSLRDRFYEDAGRITGFTQGRIKDILMANFGETFELAKMPEYLELLRLHANEERSKEALDNRRQMLRARIPDPVDPNPCPIPGCDGVMQSDRTWAWVCSKGGLRHYLVVKLSERTRLSLENALANIEGIAMTNQAQRDAELARWKAKIHEPFEPQGWHVLKEEIDEEAPRTLTYTDASAIPE